MLFPWLVNFVKVVFAVHSQNLEKKSKFSLPNTNVLFSGLVNAVKVVFVVNRETMEKEIKDITLS